MWLPLDCTGFIASYLHCMLNACHSYISIIKIQKVYTIVLTCGTDVNEWKKMSMDLALHLTSSSVSTENKP